MVKEIESMDSRSGSLRANVVIADCGILKDADGGQGKKSEHQFLTTFAS